MKKKQFNLEGKTIICNVCRCPLPEDFFSWREKDNHSRGNVAACRVCNGYYNYKAKLRPDEPVNLCGGDWLASVVYFGNQCAICGSPFNLCLDHWYPRGSIWGRGHIPENIVPLCASCNTQKREYHPFDWLAKYYGVVRAYVLMARVEKYHLIAARYDWQEIIKNAP